MDFTQKDLFTTDLTSDYANVTIGSGIDTTYTLSNLAITTSSISVSPTWANGGPYITSNGAGSYTWANMQPAASIAESGKLSLQGDNADIEINGESLMTAIRKIEERLNILKPNEKLEAEWDQLRELGEQYRALEKKLMEQSEMWDALKKMPPPEIS